MAAAVGTQKMPSKLCRRTFFLQSGTAPSDSEIRHELGAELADIIIDTLQPSQRTAVQPDRILVTSTPTTGHDSATLRRNIHEHILCLGGEISQRVQRYWRNRVRKVAETVAKPDPDDLDFLRFECRQRVTIAREEERRRYEALLRTMEDEIRQRTREEKGDLHRSYGEARALWGEFVCRKVRKQAKDLLCQIAVHYRERLEREVTQHTQLEKTRILQEMERIVKTAVEQQKRSDERAMQWLVYQYEELLRFANEYNECLEAVEVTRELCRLHATQRECRSTQVSACPSVARVENSSLSTRSNLSMRCEDDGDLTEIRPFDPSRCNAFVISQCLPKLEAEPVSEEENRSVEKQADGSCESLVSEKENVVEDVESSQSSIEKLIIGGITYAQPKYIYKTYNELFGEVPIRWERIDPVVDAHDDVPQSTSETDHIRSSSSHKSEPSYRESYDAVTELREMLLPPDSSVQSSSTGVGADGEYTHFEALFDPSKSDDEIAEIADSFASLYIRTTSEDFRAMFPKDNNVN